VGGPDSFWNYLPFLLKGIPITLELTFISMAVAIPVSVLLAVARGSKAAFLRWPAGFVVEFLRGSSALVQLFWAFYVLPFFGINLPPMVAAILVLGLNEGAYFSEVVRAGLNAVPKGQREAAIALHLSARYRFFKVILPQALPIMIPPFGNALVAMLKFTALVSLVSIQDISFRAGMIRTSTGQSAPTYGATLLIYFILALCLAGLVRLIERRVSKAAGRPVRPLIGRGESSIPAWALGGGK
jgi:polar amino acid transport system permease protein